MTSSLLPPIDIKEIQAKSILTPSKLPDADFVINPYIGCRFGCTYCYASFMARYSGKDIHDWGKFVYAKTNAPELLEKELKKLKNFGQSKSICISSVTDPYQGVEAKYRLTRQCLEVLADYGFEGTIGILTKSDLVLRDSDILKRLKNVEVGLTITSTDDSISRYFEQFAPTVSQRLKALKELNAQHIKTYAFVGPLLPHFVADPQKLDQLFREVSETGTKEVYVEHLNLSNYILGRLRTEMPDLDKTIVTKFYESKTVGYREELDMLIGECVTRYGLSLRLGGTIYHKDSLPN